MGMATSPLSDADLAAKAKEKCQQVQEFIRDLEKALGSFTPQDKSWLRELLGPESPCLDTLIRLFLEPKYQSFASLCCVSLRAVQILLRVGAQFVVTGGGSGDHDVGWLILQDLVGVEQANQTVVVVKRLALGPEPNTACSAMLLLAEFGPEAFALSLCPQLMCQLLDLFVALPDRADDLVEVGLRAHAWGGEHRAALLRAAAAHRGGQLLCEVLLQVINRAEPRRRSRALKVLTGCLSLEGSEGLLYTNDLRVLVEILLRELPDSAWDPAAFACHADCYKALVLRCLAARVHRRDDALQVFEDIREDERCDPLVRGQCTEVLQTLEALGA